MKNKTNITREYNKKHTQCYINLKNKKHINKRINLKYLLITYFFPIGNFKHFFLFNLKI